MSVFETGIISAEVRRSNMNMTAEDGQTRVFLSYSRKDFDFVAWLSPALKTHGFIADFDQSKDDPGNVATGIFCRGCLVDPT